MTMTARETVAAHFAGAPHNPDTLFWRVAENPAPVVDAVERATGYPIFAPVLHLGFHCADLRPDRCGVVVLHRITATDAELLAAGPPIIWRRLTLSVVARWIFDDIGLSQVSIRARSDDMCAREYAMRLGFKFDTAAQLWRMTRQNCRWLKNGGAH